MESRFSHILVLLITAIIVVAGCKGTAIGPNGNTNTNTNIGDSIPKYHSHYYYERAQLDTNNNIILVTRQFDGFSLTDTTGLTILGKNNVFLIYDQDQTTGTSGDTSYYSYEASSDVSVYLQNPGFLINYGDGGRIDETLQTIVNLVFHNWITLPVASKKTNIYNISPKIDINGQHPTANIQTVVEFIGDSSILTHTPASLPADTTTLAVKHCRITITAKMTLNGPYTLTHVRDVWFAPKIGYIAKQLTRTFVPADSILVIPLDTMGTFKELTNYVLN